MKKYVLILLTVSIAATIKAQDAGLPPRPYKPEELKRWTMLCENISQAVPSGYKGYSVKKDNCGSFEWAEVNNKKQPLTIINKKNEPIGNNPNFSIWFTKNADSADLEIQKIQLQINDAVNKDGSFNQEKMNSISAQTEKFEQTRTLSVYITCNSKVSYNKQYFKGIKPEKIELPVPAFAYLYLFPKGKEVKEEGASLGTDAMEFYKDKALIIISAKAPKVSTDSPANCTWKEDIITPQDLAPENIMAPLKNIVISINGGEEDVRVIIQQINWKALQSLLGK